jgi:hypothetical protein
MSKTKDYCLGGWMVSRFIITDVKPLSSPNPKNEWPVVEVFRRSSQQASPQRCWCQCDCWRPCVGTVTCNFWKIRNGLMTGILMDNADAFLKLAFTQLFLNGQEVTLVSGRLNECELFQHQGRWVLWFGSSEEIRQSYVSFKSYYFTLNITNNISLQIDVRKSITEFNVRREQSFSVGNMLPYNSHLVQPMGRRARYGSNYGHEHLFGIYPSLDVNILIGRERMCPLDCSNIEGQGFKVELWGFCEVYLLHHFKDTLQKNKESFFQLFISFFIDNRKFCREEEALILWNERCIPRQVT